MHLSFRRSKGSNETQSFLPWPGSIPLGRILVIRLHAVGDVAITLPYCASLRRNFPNAQIDFLTSQQCSGLATGVRTFDTVHILAPAGHRLSRLLTTLRFSLIVRNHHYDAVIDLQRNWMSRTVRRFSSAAFWGELNRFAPLPAGDRVQQAFVNAGLSLLPQFKTDLREEITERARQVLMKHDWDGHTKLIILNPAGLWVTRNWPLENYVRLGKLWLEKEKVSFLILGTNRIFRTAEYLESHLGDSLINLAGKTTLEEALGVIQFTSGIVSEDSGLMHMTWVSGIPTLALFGSSRHEWSAPLGSHSECLHSGDLECGACMESSCRFGDTHCLTRYTPEFVLERALELM